MNQKPAHPAVKPRCHEDTKLSLQIHELLRSRGIEEQVAVAIITNQKNLIGSPERRWSGWQAKRFGYPASLYKLYIAGALIEKASHARHYDLLSVFVEILKENVVVEEGELSSPLVAGQKKSVKELLKLMITRSDNTAANVLISFLGMPMINKFIRKNGWRGSEITKRFLPKDRQDKEERKAEPTKTCVLHLAEFMMCIDSLTIGGRIMSTTLKTLLLCQEDGGMLDAGLPGWVVFSHKTGWFQTIREGKLIGVTGDAGIVEVEGVRYYIACLTKLVPKEGRRVLEELALPLHELIISYLRELNKKKRAP
jgi:hypothetical protein